MNFDKLTEYLESLNRTQNRLIQVYEEFGRVVGQLPLRIGDVFSEEPFELLENPQKKEKGTSGEKQNENKGIKKDEKTDLREK